MNDLGEGEVDIIKAPIVIDNVCLLKIIFSKFYIFKGIRSNESWSRRRV